MPTETPGSTPARVPVTLFYSYAHEDEPYRTELQKHLMILERRKVIRSWTDRAIQAGSDWDKTIDEHLRSADVVLLLLSNDFIASDYIWGEELRIAMERHARGETVVVPIMVRPIDLQADDAADLPFVKLQGLPKDFKPVTTWANADEAWTNVAGGIRQTVNAINARRVAVVAGAPAAVAPVPAPTPAPDRSETALGLAPPDLMPIEDVFSVTGASPATAAPAPSPAGSKVAPDVAPARAPSEDHRLDDVVGEFVDQLTKAAVAKGAEAPDATELRSQAIRLIDMPEWKRVLWVDDHPQNNRAEIAAFARLQVEVVTAASTNRALAELASSADDPFALVISDWQRQAEGPLAGLSLLRSMRALGHTQPVVYYHGTFGSVPRTALKATALAAGAFGEATLPDELMRLVLQALHA